MEIEVSGIVPHLHRSPGGKKEEIKYWEGWWGPLGKSRIDKGGRVSPKEKGRMFGNKRNERGYVKQMRC